MSLCPVCGNAMCDHTPEERYQTSEEMMRELTPDELVAHASGDAAFKLATAIRVREFQSCPGSMVADGVTCAEYALIAIAGPSRKELPEAIQDRMRGHEIYCRYHSRELWHRAAHCVRMTPKMEAAAAEVIKKIHRSTR